MKGVLPKEAGIHRTCGQRAAIAHIERSGIVVSQVHEGVHKALKWNVMEAPGCLKEVVTTLRRQSECMVRALRVG